MKTATAHSPWIFRQSVVANMIIGCVLFFPPHCIPQAVGVPNFIGTVNHGTTVVAVQIADSVLIGADSRLISVDPTTSRVVAHQTTAKIRIIKQKAFALAGLYHGVAIMTRRKGTSDSLIEPAYDAFKIATDAFTRGRDVDEASHLFWNAIDPVIQRAWWWAKFRLHCEAAYNTLQLITAGSFRGNLVTYVLTISPRYEDSPGRQIATAIPQIEQLAPADGKGGPFFKIVGKHSREYDTKADTTLVRKDPAGFIKKVISDAIVSYPIDVGPPIKILSVHRNSIRWIQK